MIDDIYQLCKTNEQRHTANVMLISRFIKMRFVEMEIIMFPAVIRMCFREFDRALEILDNNSPCEIKNCCLSLIQIMKWNDQVKFLLFSCISSFIINTYSISDEIIQSKQTLPRHTRLSREEIERQRRINQ